MYKSAKNNRYKYQVGDTAWLVYNLKNVCEIKIEKKLKRPFRLSDNFYFCTWSYLGVTYKGVRYESEIYKTWEKALNAIEKNRKDDIL